MRLKQLVILTIATLCCTTVFAGVNAVPTEKYYTDSIREGQTYLFYDYFVTEPGDYNTLLQGVGGYDNLLMHLHLNVLPACTDIEVSYTDSIVLGESYLLANKIITPTEVGTLHEQTIIARASGCDSTINLTLKVKEPCSDIEVAYTDSIVLGETYLFIDQFITPTEVGTVNTSAIIPRVGGCDSTINLTLKVLEPCSDIAVAYTDSIVLGETYLFINQFITPTEVGTVNTSAIIPRVGGCDSTINLTLKVLEPCSDITVAYTDSIVLGETYLFIDQFITPTEVGTVNTSAIIPRVGGCDSTINLTLKVLEPCSDITVAYTDSIVLGETYLFIDQFITPTEVGTVNTSAIILRVGGCDSTINLTLKVLPDCEDVEVAYTDSIFVGESYLFIDTLITMSDADTVTCQRIIPRVAGCDSTINLTLIAKWVYARDTLRDTISKDLCYKEQFTDRLGVEYHPTQDTVVLDTISNVQIDTVGYTITNYDSIYRYELKVWPAMTTTTQTDSLNADYGSFTWNLGSRDSIITDFTIDAVNHREYMYKNILGGDSAKFVLDVTVWPAMTTTTQTDSVCATYGSFIWSLGSRDSIITDFTIDAVNHREYMYQNILGGDSAKFILDVTVWPATKYPTAKKDTIDEDQLPYIWTVAETGHVISCDAMDTYHDTLPNMLGCDSVIFELQLTVRTVERHEAKQVVDFVCKGTEYQSRLLPTHIINGLTEWQDSLRLQEGLVAIDSIYTYKIDTLPTRIPDSEISNIKAYCDYPVDYSYASLNVAEFVQPAFIFAQISDTIWEVETAAGWKPAATTIITGDDKSIRVRCTVVTECETTVSTSEPYEVKMASADDKEELTIPASQKYGNRIIMVDKNATEELGWTIPETDVDWYRVVGTQDDHSYTSNPADWDDELVKQGSYYLTRPDGNPLEGEFYAIIPGAMLSGMTCGTELRTVLLQCNPANASAPKLAPNMVAPGETMELTGLNDAENYTVRVIATDGSEVNNFEAKATKAMQLKAATVPGMYIVNVMNDKENVSLKYIVK